MNPSEILVLALLAAGVALAIRRNLRKGIPCESRGACCGNCAGCKAHGGCPARALAHPATRRTPQNKP